MAALLDCEAVNTTEVIDPLLFVSVSLFATTNTQGAVKVPAIGATWAAITNQFVTGIQFEYGPADLSYGIIKTYPQSKGSLSWNTTAGITAGKNVVARYRAVGGPNTFGGWSSPVTLTVPNQLIATGFVGQTTLATAEAVDWATQVTGVAKPQNNATASRVFNQQFSPASPNANDIWVETDGGGVPQRVKAWNGTVWVTSADMTGFNIAAGITGQGWGATASEVQARNSLIPVGQNRVINSDLPTENPGNQPNYLPRGFRPGWGGNGPTGPGNWDVSYNNARQAALRVNFTPAYPNTATGTVFDNAVNGGDGSLEGYRRFGVQVKPNDRVVFAARVGKYQVGKVNLTYAWYRQDGSYITEGSNETTAVYTGADVNGNEVPPRDWPRLYIFATAPAEAAFAGMWQRGTTDGRALPHLWMTEPLIAIVPADQTAVPVYAPGPSDRFADRTGENISTGVVGQGPGATAPGSQVLNSYVPFGVNVVVNSDFKNGAFGHRFVYTSSDRPVDYGTNYPGYSEVTNTAYLHLSGNPAGGTYTDAWRSSPSDSLQDITRFGLPVAQGQRIYYGALVANHRNANTCVIVFGWNAAGNFVEAGISYGGRINGGNNGDPVNFDRVGDFHVWTHPDVKYCTLGVRMNHSGEADPYIFHTQEQLCRVADGQLAVPPYSSGPPDPLGDRTAANIAAGFTGQGYGATATQEQVGNSHVTAAGPNILKWSQFERGLQATGIGYNPGPGISIGIGDGGGNQPYLVFTNANTPVGISEFGSVLINHPFTAWAEAMDIVPGSRVCIAVRGRAATGIALQPLPRINVYDSAYTNINDQITYVVLDANINEGGYGVYYCIVDLPATAVKASLEVYGRKTSNGASGPATYAFDRPMVRQISRQSLQYPGYVQGPNSVNGADPTGSNVAAAVVGQGPGATAGFPSYAGNAAAFAALGAGKLYLNINDSYKITTTVNPADTRFYVTQDRSTCSVNTSSTSPVTTNVVTLTPQNSTGTVTYEWRNVTNNWTGWTVIGGTSAASFRNSVTAGQSKQDTFEFTAYNGNGIDTSTGRVIARINSTA